LNRHEEPGTASSDAHARLYSHPASAVARSRIDDRLREAGKPRHLNSGEARRLGGEDLVEIVRAAAAGDARSWDRLVGEYRGMVGAVARAHRLGDADACDVAQSTWLKLLEHLGQLNDPSRVGAWLATTARRECLRVLRAGKRQVLTGNELHDDEARDVSVDRELLIAERDAALWRSFSRLRPRDQALLRLLTADPRRAYEEVSAALDLPIGSIGPTRARALERLRQELENDGSLALLSARWRTKENQRVANHRHTAQRFLGALSGALPAGVSLFTLSSLLCRLQPPASPWSRFPLTGRRRRPGRPYETTEQRCDARD
jgi:RNA polymerase sigma factor (sigma-70 family)